MQRLFSTFANGWPGGGLLLQRALTAAVLLHSIVAHMAPTSPPVSTVLEVISAAAGVLLLVGLWTPVVGVIVALAELGIIFSHPGDPWVHITLATLGASLAMLGPGAWSIDARLFGRKEIEIPGR